MFLWRCKKLVKCPTWCLSLLNLISRGGVRPPFSRRLTPLGAFRRLMASRQTPLNQVLEGA